MNYAVALPEPDFFDAKGLLKEYRSPPMQQQIGSMNILRKIPDPSNAILISEYGEEILPVEEPKQPNNVPLVSDPMPDPVPPPEFLFTEFPSTKVVTQSQIDISSISDTLDRRETSNSLRKATRSTDFPLKSMQNRVSHEEMREVRDLTVSEKHIQSTRDSSTISISDNSTTRKSISGIKTDSPTALRVETDISFKNEGEIQQIEQ